MTEQARSRVAVVVDSSAYLPPEIVQEHDIHVIPLLLMMGGKSWLDGVDIDPPAFYELLRTSADFPTTSQPNVAAFEELFHRLAGEYSGILFIAISAKPSGTFASAQTAAAYVAEVPIEIIDSQGTSMLIGYAAMAAARVAAAGASLAEVADAARSILAKGHLYFVLGTLEYLHRGGRIGSVSKLLGSALDLKPILSFEDGVIKAIAKVRTRRKALERVYDLIADSVWQGCRLHVSVINVAAPQEAAAFRDALVERFHPVEVIETETSPAIGAHAGPGTVGVAFYVE
jgi:DegV family protein with EDD domain